ncbi:MAG: penicillin acylase family protein [Actinobacteria bacterium]|nr:MAG: penicillin acylase family protein [Actinomycetota bacterium]
MPARVAIAVLCALAVLAPAAAAAPAPEPFGTNDFGGFHDILPPGTNGTANAAQLTAFLALGQRPEHNATQLPMYGDLVHAAPGLPADQLDKYFKDSTFGVPPDQVERTYSPRDDVVIVRDKQFGVPHIYGATRDGAMFGLGYAAAEDRLFLMDALRHVGRAELSSFAGGAQGNRDFDQMQWSVAPYTEDDLQRQVDQFPQLYGAEGLQIGRDSLNYVAGVNQYIDEAKLDPTKMPGEYAALGRPQGPDPWKLTDIIATAALVGGIFGKGGGGELADAQTLQALQGALGKRHGKRVWRDFRELDDPEAPTTVKGKVFRYGVPPGRPRGLAMPDPGSVTPAKIVANETGGGGGASGLGAGLALGGLGGARIWQHGMSNALLVSAAHSQSGHPLAVFGPQTGYFAPQLLMEQDVHAPASDAGPAIDARGAAFAGTNLYVELGHGRDYAWSATSAGQDIIDTYAVSLCDPGGGPAAKDSNGYLFHGRCLPMEDLVRKNSWEPNLADPTPAGTETLRVQRTKYGLVIARGTVRGKPVAFTNLRRTYFHEIDSGFGFADFNNPDAIRSPQDFQRAANKILYTFNWFYADDKHIAYFNSGANPVRPPGVDQNLPTLARERYEWRGWNADDNTAPQTAFEAHPQAIDQDFLTSWNNKPARGYRASGFGGYGPVYRSQSLDFVIRNGIAGGRKMSLVDLVNGMEDAGTVDLRGTQVLPWALKVIGPPTRLRPADRALAGAVELLRAWAISGAHRRDRDGNGHYEQSEAIRLMDAWWPRMLEAMFEPALGRRAFDAIHAQVPFDDHNRDDHVGSAFQDGWFSYANKDLRRVLGHHERGAYSQVYCGRGRLSRCRAALLSSLRAAMGVPASELYKDPLCPAKEMPDLQMCTEAIRQVPTGGVTQPLIEWVNRPTYQQAVEVQGHRP